MPESAICAATREYERWLGGFTPLVAADLQEKHRQMREDSAFGFLRATFYRWCQRWLELPEAERSGLPVLSVGDLHLANFGTWRDADGRLVWGVNDFDEAATLPWTQDLVRLAASAHLAIRDKRLDLKRRHASAALWEGYRRALELGGQPFVLEEHHAWLRHVALDELRQPPAAFWAELAEELSPVAEGDAIPRKLLVEAMPAPGLELQFFHRRAGRGSLGRPRFVALAHWRGGSVAREAKARAPSAWAWASGQAQDRIGAESLELVSRAVRAPDPTLRIGEAWTLRRLAPHCVKLGLDAFSRAGDAERLLDAMGFETANVHLGTAQARKALARELHERSADWLHALAKRCATAVEQDQADWRRAGARGD